MRARLRDLGIEIGLLPPGPLNAITDVPGVRVGHTTLIYDEPHVARTGVTVILARGVHIWDDYAPAGFHVLNGTGEMTGIHWLNESGLLCTPIALTNTHQVGLARDALSTYGQQKGYAWPFSLPVATETYDGWLNDTSVPYLKPEHVYAAIENAADGPVPEGNVGGGTGMICHGFKGGIGTASRMVEVPSGRFVVGALVQANHGRRVHLQVDGVPVGRLLDGEARPSATPVAEGGKPPTEGDGSLIVILATNAPLLPVQCRRLAQRATIGMARVGGMGHHGSGDLFLAFATGNHHPDRTEEPIPLLMLPHHQLDPFFEAATEAVEEAILNTLTAAETMTGRDGHTVHALPLDELMALMER